MPRYSKKTPMTSANINDLADTFAGFADRYRSLAKEMDEKKVEVIQGSNMKSVLDAVAAIQTAVNLAQAAYDSELTQRGVFAELGLIEELTPAQQKRLRDDIRRGQQKLADKRGPKHSNHDAPQGKGKS